MSDEERPQLTHHEEAVRCLHQLALLMVDTGNAWDESNETFTLAQTMGIAHQGALVMGLHGIALALLSIDEALRTPLRVPEPDQPTKPDRRWDVP